MSKILLYMHGGSGNKGCEAIVRSTAGILNKQRKNEITLATWNKDEDIGCGLDENISVYQAADIAGFKGFKKYACILFNRVFKSQALKYRLVFSRFSKLKDRDFDMALSIGGDNYCYPGGAQLSEEHRKDIDKAAEKVFLWGCSVEEVYLGRKTIENLKKYDCIFARESLTYNALKRAGIVNVRLFPDPAFTLAAEKCDLPEGFERADVVGVNLSPYAYSKDAGLSGENYKNLIKWILKNTEMNIALIPHVNTGRNRDDDYLELIKKEFPSDRVIKIRDMDNCMQTKYVISKCRFFIGARTHATIAAYSSKVPTIVLGYSVKAKGIARDIFGGNENYLLSVNDFKTGEDLLEKFKLMLSNEDKIRKHYDEFMDGYIEKAYEAGEEIFRFSEA